MNKPFLTIAAAVTALLWMSWSGVIPPAAAIPICTAAGIVAGAMGQRLPRLRGCDVCRMHGRNITATHVLMNGRLVCEAHAAAAPMFRTTSARIPEPR